MSSFTMMIKDEICQKSFRNCCQKSLLSAFISLNKPINKHGTTEIKIHSFHEPTIKLIVKLLKIQVPEINFNLLTKKYKNTNRYEIVILGLTDKVNDSNYLLKSDIFDVVNNKTKKHCIRAYIVGIFLLCGSINSPQTANYHLELQLDDRKLAEKIQKLLLRDFDLNFKNITRRKKKVLYLKKSNDISDFLKLLDCSQAVFSFEEQRITRELLNTINRFNNIDISNQQKTLNASLKQVAMIVEIKAKNCFGQLSEKCQILSDLRLANQDASLAELSELYYQKTGKLITKSGVNHLMRELRSKYKELLSA